MPKSGLSAPRNAANGHAIHALGPIDKGTKAAGAPSQSRHQAAGGQSPQAGRRAHLQLARRGQAERPQGHERARPRRRCTRARAQRERQHGDRDSLERWPRRATTTAANSSTVTGCVTEQAVHPRRATLGVVRCGDDRCDHRLVRPAMCPAEAPASGNGGKAIWQHQQRQAAAAPAIMATATRNGNSGNGNNGSNGNGNHGHALRLVLGQRPSLRTVSYGSEGSARRQGPPVQGSKVKRHRPHILVVIALAVVLSTGWHGALRNALTDLRFAWQSRTASGNDRRGGHRRALDRPDRDMALAAPAPRGAAAQARGGGGAGRRLRRRFQHAIGSGLRRGPRHRASGGRRFDDPAVLQAAGAEWWRGSHQSSTEAVQQPVVAGRRQCCDRIRRARAPLSGRREAWRCRDAVDGRRAGRAGCQSAAALPDRFRHSCGLHPKCLLF